MVFFTFNSHRNDHTVQIVATLGPSSFRLAQRLAEAGATGFRFNASHFEPQALRQHVLSIRRIRPDAPIIIDIQGAKMRLGRFEPKSIRTDERVAFSAVSARDDVIPLPHGELFEQVRVGETLTINDARLRFEVLSVAPDLIEARSLDNGRIEARKGVNVQEHPVQLRDLAEHDRTTLRSLDGCEPLAWAFSFMRDGSESRWIRGVTGDCVVVGKIELREALARLGQIERSVDALWICRGDLGAQIGAIELARWFGSFDPLRFSRPVLVAGQVLEHLTANPTPTRSEICHLHDLLARGYAGIVLSDETAIGVDPERSVRVAAELVDSFVR